MSSLTAEVCPVCNAEYEPDRQVRGFEELRKPFPRESIGILPKPYKKESPKGNCHECGGYHGLPAVHSDFVGHAIVTDRLITVDPEWTWEPFAVDAKGLPALDADGNLWIRLTILGVTRPGVGDGNGMKERIGDAIRNAAMRFGVALNLWSKDELESLIDEPKIPRPTEEAPPAWQHFGYDDQQHYENTRGVLGELWTALDDDQKLKAKEWLSERGETKRWPLSLDLATELFVSFPPQPPSEPESDPVTPASTEPTSERLKAPSMDQLTRMGATPEDIAEAESIVSQMRPRELDEALKIRNLSEHGSPDDWRKRLTAQLTAEICRTRQELHEAASPAMQAEAKHESEMSAAELAMFSEDEF